MAKQSATNPRFRCNGCKEYHSVPKNKVYYQCAVHGYLCTEHFTGPKSEAIPYSVDVKIPKKHYGKCGVWDKSDSIYKKHGMYLSANSLERIVCLKNLIRFNWHEDVGRWIEEGREKEEKAKAKPKTISGKKPDYVNDIGVLVDLLEDDTLTKEVFIKKIREKLK